MPRTPLRRALLRLAAEHPDMRSDLVRILRADAQAPAAMAVPMAMPMMVMPVMTPMMPMMPMAMPAPAPPPAPVKTVVVHTDAEPETPVPAAIGVPDRARQGFEVDLLPEMERLVAGGVSRQRVARHILGLIAEAFEKKNHLYNILIRSQSSFEGDGAYRRDLERLVEAWTTSNAGA